MPAKSYLHRRLDRVRSRAGKTPAREKVHLSYAAYMSTGSTGDKPRRRVRRRTPLERVRRMCLALPETSERLSHGEPTFFVHKRVFVMFANNHHHDGHIAAWLPVPPGIQTGLIQIAPETYFKPPYVGPSGWVGIELDQIGDEELSAHIQAAWEMVAPKRLLSKLRGG